MASAMSSSPSPTTVGAASRGRTTPTSKSAMRWIPDSVTHHHNNNISDRLPILATQSIFRNNAHHIMEPGSSPAANSSSSPLPWASFSQSPAPQNHYSSLSKVKPVHAEGGLKAMQKLSDEIDDFVKHEIGILASQNDGSGADMGPQRLGVYKAVFRMILTGVPQPLHRHLEAIVSEYDRFLQSLEIVAQDHTRLKERQRLESHYAQHFTEEARIKEAALEKKKREFDAVEASMRSKLSNLEKQLAALQNENRSLRAQQNEDTERYSSMAQAVIESRLAASKAELQLIEMREIYEKVRFVEKNNLEIMQDYGKMLKLCRFNKINFEPKCQAMLDTLLREGIM